MIDSSFRSAASTGPTQVSSAVSTPTPADRTTTAEPAAHPFAELLRQQRSAVAPRPATADADHVPAAATASRPPAPAGDANDSAATTSAPTSVAGRDASQARTRNNPSGRAAVRSDNADSATDAAGASTGSAATQADARDADTKGTTPTMTAEATLPVPTAAVATALLATPRSATAAPGALDARETALAASDLAAGRTAGDARGGVGATDGGANASATAAASSTTASGIGTDSRSTRLDANAIGTDRSAAGDPSADVKTSTTFAAAPGETTAVHAAAGTERSTHDSAAMIAPTGDAAQPPVSGSTTAVASASVATPVDAPDFAAAFGMQVSVLAKDGVQQAELHLNPADMGPVSIHITLDGSLAHVDFGADVAATRHAIEAGLPELASALRDAGFTLAGGGVAQHSGSNAGARDDAPANRSNAVSAPASRAAVGALASAQRRMQRAAAGGVDLFA